LGHDQPEGLDESDGEGVTSLDEVLDREEDDDAGDTPDIEEAGAPEGDVPV
jgi:hypothetical protein